MQTLRRTTAPSGANNTSDKTVDFPFPSPITKSSNDTKIDIVDRERNQKLDVNSKQIDRINLINAIHGGYCYLITMVWVISSHFISHETGFGQFYYLLLLVATLYLFCFAQSKSGMYKSEPAGHYIIRELIFGLSFFVDFLIMFFILCAESALVYVISWINPNKFNPNEQTLNDTVRMFFVMFNDKSKYSLFGRNLYRDIWRNSICKGYIPSSAFIFVLWAVLLMVGQAPAPHASGFIFGQKYCRCVALSRIVRTLCFFSTILPSSHHMCHLSRFTDWRLVSQVPDEIKQGKFYDEPFRWDHFTSAHRGGGCNDLIFSGHCVIIFATLCVYQELYFMYKNYFGNILKQNKIEFLVNDVGGSGGGGSNTSTSGDSIILNAQQTKRKISWILFGMKCSVIYIWWLSILSGLKMITEGHHYAVDVIAALFVTALVYIKLGSQNIATSELFSDINVVDSNEIKSKIEKTKNSWFFIDVRRCPTYIAWINNVNDIRNYNWTARFISKRKLDVSTSRDTDKPKPNKGGLYLILCLAIPFLFIFGWILPGT